MKYKMFPVGENKRPPFQHNWQDVATKDPTRIQKYRNHMNQTDKKWYWAIPTGSENGLLVLDVDPKRGGDVSLGELIVPPTRSQITQSGGIHYVYKYPDDGKRYTNKTDKPLLGLDIRGEGGYIVYYGWDDGEYPIEEPPQWLLDASLATERVVGALNEKGEPNLKIAASVAQEEFKRILGRIRGTKDGGRYTVLNDGAFFSGQLIINGGLKNSYVEPLLIEAGKLIGLDEDEVIDTVIKGIADGYNKPRDLPKMLTQGLNDTVVVPSLPESGKSGVLSVVVEPPPLLIEIAEDYMLDDTDALKRPQIHEGWSSFDLSLFVASGGTGKTTLRICEAICGALGRPFLNQKSVRAVKSLFLIGEDDEKKHYAIQGQILKSMGLINDKDIRTRIRNDVLVKKLVNFPLVTNENRTYSPNMETLNQIKAVINEHGVHVLIIDPLSFFWGHESGFTDSAVALIRWCNELRSGREDDLGIELIHHSSGASAKMNDMGQFSSRGGTTLPSHCRISKALRRLNPEEFASIIGKDLKSQ